MGLRGNTHGDNWAHVCGAFLGGTILIDTPLCWWCGKDIHRAVPLTDPMRAAYTLGGQEAVRVILRTIPDIAAEVPVEMTVTVSINGIPVMTDVTISSNHFIIIASPGPTPGAGR